MKLYLLLFSLLFLGCTPNSNKVGKENEKGGENIDKFRFTNHALEDSTLFKECHIVPLETNDDSFIQKISRIYKTNDDIFILDKSLNKLSVFDVHGNYRHKIENIGNGPHEYVSVMDFCLDTEKKEILLLCDRPYKIMRFKYDGQFVEEIKQTDLFRNILMSDGYIYCNRIESGKRGLNEYEIYCMSSNGEPRGNILKRRDNITNKTHHVGNFLNKSKYIYYTRRFDNRVYQVTGNESKERYTLDFGKFNVPEHLSEEQDFKKFRSECDEKKYIYSITEFTENEKYIIFLTNQAICVYDKNKETFTGYPTIKNSEFGIESNSFLANGNDGNSIFMTINPAMLYMLKDYMDDNENIASLFEKVKEDDNPILLFYQFKV